MFDFIHVDVSYFNLLSGQNGQIRSNQAGFVEIVIRSTLRHHVMLLYCYLF